MKGRAFLRFLCAAAAILFTAATASAQTTALFLDSQTGDWVGAGARRTFTAADGVFDAGRYDGGVRAHFESPDYSHWWSIYMKAADGVTLRPGFYNDVRRWPFTKFDALDVSGDSRGCNRLTGRFWLRELVYGANNTVIRLAVDFEQHCEDDGVALFGAWRYNSTISSLVPFDGYYPSYHLAIVPTPHGVVTGAGLQCDPGGTACALGLSSPTELAIQATPDPGYMFGGWTGSCSGPRATTVWVNSDKTCAPVFRPIASGTVTTTAMLSSQAGSWVGDGRRQVFNPVNSRWQLSWYPDVGWMYVSMSGTGPDTDTDWHMSFSAPAGTALAPGVYADVGPFGMPGKAGMSVGGDGHGCNTENGSFVIRELAVSNGTVTRLALDFEQRCENQPSSPVRGSIRYNSALDPLPSVTLTTVGSGGVTIVPSGTACVDKCIDTFAPGTSIQLVAAPQPGWALGSWAGDADCTDGIVTMNSPVACQATFVTGVVAANSASPATSSGNAQTFTLQYSATSPTSVATAWAWFTTVSFASSAHSCLLRVERATNTVSLLDDLGATWLSATAGTGTLQNSQCSIDLSGVSGAASGSQYTVTLPVQFNGTEFAGTKNIYLFASGVGGATSGWVDRGDWTVPPGPPPVVTAVSVSPSAGTGASQVFAAQYYDSSGATNLAQVWLSIGSSPTSADACVVQYDGSRILLLNYRGEATKLGVPGQQGTLQNSLCTVSLAGVSNSLNGTMWTFTVPVQFGDAAGSAKNIFLSATDRHFTTTGWVDRGDWIVPGPPVATADVVSPNIGTGTTQLFALQYSDTASATNLRTMWAWFSSSMAATAESCLTYSDGTSLYLLDDAGTTWQSGLLGASGTLQNSQCAVALSGSSRAMSGTALTLSLAMTFTPAYAGAKNVYMYATNARGSGSGWQDRGDWIVPIPPPAAVTADSASPNTGTSTTQTFALQYSHSFDVSRLQTGWVWFTSSSAASPANSCLLRYEYFADRLSLLNDAGTEWISAFFGLSGVLQNSQCAVTLPGSFSGSHGTSLVINLPMTFKSGYAGTKHIYMYTTGVGGLADGWVDRGTWTVPATGAAVTADSAAVIVNLGFSQVIEARYTDTLGGGDVRSAWIWITNAFGGSAAGSCLMYYDAASGAMSVLNDTGSVWQAAAMGSSTALGNSQCTVHVGTSDGLASGNAFTLQANTSFSGSYVGTTQHIYIFAAGSSTNSGWQDAGTLTIP